MRSIRKHVAMESPAETVRAFFAKCEEPGAIEQAYRDYFTAETVFENVGLVTTTGPDEAVALIANSPMKGVRVELLAVAEAGDKVLTERIDHLFGAEGAEVHTLRVMGIFEVANGRIAAWRDYFDTVPFRQAH
jgi:limonene-1,2-epoxide hydrolase